MSDWLTKNQVAIMAVHDAIKAVKKLEFSAGDANWLTSIRKMQQLIQVFSGVIPKSKEILILLDAAEKMLVAAGAIAIMVETVE